jgi:hypothetical protein
MVISRLQQLLKRHVGIKIRGWWNRGTIFQALQLAALSGKREAGSGAMIFKDKCTSGYQRR